MERLERFYLIDDLLQSNIRVSREKLLRELGVSKATLDRDIRDMRDRFFAPISFDRERGGYYLNKADPFIKKYHLPGLWLSDREIVAILILQDFLDDVVPGLLGDHVERIRETLRKAIGDRQLASKQFRSRVNILHFGHRRGQDKYFSTVGYALMASKRLRIIYYSRPRDNYSEREISPLRLVYYRGVWYLDAWCHSVDGFRLFSLDAIDEAALLNKNNKRISKKVLDEHVTGGYGIFSGKPKDVAKIRFSKKIARWVSKEEWHPNQEAQFDNDGRYVLKVPFSDDRELLMDILKYGPEAEVLAPKSLREKAKILLSEANSLYLLKK